MPILRQALVSQKVETLGGEVASGMTLVGQKVEILAAEAAVQILVGQKVETLLTPASALVLVAVKVEILAPYTPPPTRKIRATFISGRIRGA